MAINRRDALLGALSAAALTAQAPSALAAELSKSFKPLAGPRSRVLFVNDLSGDVDGLFAAVHAILSASIDLRSIIGTATRDPTETAERSAALGTEILALMGLAGRVPVLVGASDRISASGKPVPSPGTQAIIDEAMRTDSRLPLYVAVGGGLTEVASALMIEPRIAGRLTLVWIGGDALPDGGTGETNFNIDPIAAQYVFNETSVPIWQIPRAVYATCVVSATELQAFVAPHGAIGPWLQDRLLVLTRRSGNRLNTGETWTLGDNPLVALTALTDWVPSSHTPSLRFERTGSSLFDEVVAPRLNSDGTFAPRSEGRKIRVYRSVDTRLMLTDFFAKIRVNYGS
jgi:purine nucleosidase